MVLCVVVLCLDITCEHHVSSVCKIWRLEFYRRGIDIDISVSVCLICVSDDGEILLVVVYPTEYRLVVCVHKIVRVVVLQCG